MPTNHVDYRDEMVKARAYVSDVMELATQYTHTPLEVQYDGNGDPKIVPTKALLSYGGFYVRCEIEPDGFVIKVIVNVQGHKPLLVATIYRGRTPVGMAADIVQAAVREAIRVWAIRVWTVTR